MNKTSLTELMHLVLDGEATDEEARELEQHLAADAGARARFGELQRLFAGLGAIPQAFPPEGLVASVMANIPQNRPPARRSSQLLADPGVIGPDTMQIRGAGHGRTKGSRSLFQPWVFFGSTNMSEQNSGHSNKRKIVIGGAIAAAAAIVAVSSLMQAPGDGKDTAGTIMPAQRYQAPQSAVQDVGAGGTAVAGTSGSNSANQPGDNTANAAGLNSGDRAGLNSGDRGGLNSGDRGGLNSGDRGGLNSGDRGGLNSGDRG
ncbi:MAG: anti-sigma factor family protein, partial [Candidatus Levyibacteriota bacterium]